MKDREFLIWIYCRLSNFYDESEAMDYMHKFRAIIADMSPDQETPNDGRGKNHIEEILGF